MKFFLHLWWFKSPTVVICPFFNFIQILKFHFLSLFVKWLCASLHQATWTIIVCVCVTAVWMSADLHQLRLSVPQCSSFIWRQGGSQAARATRLQHWTYPRLKQQQEGKSQQKSLLAAKNSHKLAPVCQTSVNQNSGPISTHRSVTINLDMSVLMQERGEILN